MIHIKIPVPRGFVILASVFDKFMKDTDAVREEDAMLDRINIQSTENIEEQSEIMRDVILEKKFPDVEITCWDLIREQPNSRQHIESIHF